MTFATPGWNSMEQGYCKYSRIFFVRTEQSRAHHMLEEMSRASRSQLGQARTGQNKSVLTLAGCTNACASA